MASNIYVIEIERWGIKNNGTDAVKTAAGINDALVWAYEQGFTDVVLPKGSYLIDETNPINLQSFMTFNLGGSVLKIRTNGLESYKVIKVYQKVYSRITNGIIEGDKDTHDYYNGAIKWQPNKTFVINNTVIPSYTVADSARYYFKCTSITTGLSGAAEPTWSSGGVVLDNGVTWTAVATSTHEGGTGINVNGGKFIAVDNLEILNFTGDAVNCGGDWGTLPYYLRFATCSLGGLSPNDGALTNEANKIRWSTKIPMNNPTISKFGTFGIYGSGYGYLGSEISATHYDVIFYKSDDTFHSAKTKIQFFDDIEVPIGTSYAKVVLYQSTIPSDNGNQLSVAVNRNCQYIYFEKLNLHHCRRQGMSLGGKYIYVRDNEIHHIKGTNPQGGIDIEDGYDLNQHYYIERNHFYDNFGYDLVITNGKHMHVLNNRFNAAPGFVSVAFGQPVDKSMFIGNIIHQAHVVIAGEFIISNNHFYGSNVALGDKDKEAREIIVGNCVFHNSPVTVNQITSYRMKINGCIFLNDSDKKNTSSFNNTLLLYNAPQIFSDCLFEGKDTNSFIYFASGDAGGWIFNNSTFINISSGLANGTYNNCKFLNPLYISYSTANKEVEFINCIFSTDNSYNINVPFFTITNKMKAFRLINNNISHYGGNFIKVQDVIDEVIISGNKIDYTGSQENKPVISIDSKFAGNKIVIESNHFSSFNKREAVENWASQFPIVIRNNILNKNVTLNLKDKEYKINNIIDDINDPYYSLSSLPNSGFYALGQEIKNTKPIAEGYMGWICVIEGYASNNVWSPSKIYSQGDRINANDHVYECQINGGQSSIIAPNFPIDPATGRTIQDINGTTLWTPNKAYAVGDLIIPNTSNGYYYKCSSSGKSGSSEPAWRIIISSTISDETVVWTTVRPIIIWKEIGRLAVFKKFGNIQP